ncbi:MAG: hypothetical protein AAF802_12510 [Planctomycetota bacterium]
MSRQGSIRWVIGIAFVAVFLRVIVLFAFPASFAEDPDAYRSIASTIAERGVFGLIDDNGTANSTVFRPPLYPWLLSFCVDGNGTVWNRVATLHIAMSTLMAIATFLAAQRLIGSLQSDSDRRGFTSSTNRLAAAAALMTIIDPILLRQSAELMTETLAALLAAITILLWAVCFPVSSNVPRFRVPVLAGLGVSLGLSYLCRPTFLVWGVFLVLALLVQRNTVGSDSRKSLGRLAGFRDRLRLNWVCAVAVLVPLAMAVFSWTIRNHRVAGHYVWATTHGGYTLLLANNESFYDYLRDRELGETWDAEPFFQAYDHRYDGDPTTEAFWRRDWSNRERLRTATSEYEDDRLCYESAKATIIRQPGMFVWSCLVRAGRFWSPLPYLVGDRSTIAISVVAVYYTIIILAVLIALVRWRTRILGPRWWAIGLLVFALTAVHAVYWSNLRMRAPVMPGLAIVAVAAFLGLGRTTRLSVEADST